MLSQMMDDLRRVGTLAVELDEDLDDLESTIKESGVAGLDHKSLSTVIAKCHSLSHLIREQAEKLRSDLDHARAEARKLLLFR